MKKIVKCGECFPAGYRAAYIDYVRGWTVAYPFGVHWLARLVRRLWEYSFRYRPSELEVQMLQVRQDAARQERKHYEQKMARVMDLLDRVRSFD